MQCFFSRLMPGEDFGRDPDAYQEFCLHVAIPGILQAAGYIHRRDHKAIPFLSQTEIGRVRNKMAY